MSKLSLFIIGMPRSGTKLFRELLNNHDEIFIPKVETAFIPKLLKKYKDRRLTAADVKQVISNIRNSMFSYYYLNSNDFDFSRLEIKDVTIKEFIDTFFNELISQRNIGAEVIGDKSPNYINDISLLLEYFSRSKFLHIVRDPKDYAISVNNVWGKNIYRAAFQWKKGINKIAELSEVYEEQIMEIRYEDLISDTEKTLRSVCDFLNIEYQKGMKYLTSSVENIGDAQLAQVDATNKGKYLVQLSPKEIKKIESLTYPLISKYYSLHSEIRFPLVPSRMKLSYWQLLDIINLLKFRIQKHGLFSAIDVIRKVRKSKK